MIDSYDEIGRLCANTPDITVFDVCGNVARQVQSNRVLPDDPLDIRVTRNVYSINGFLTSSIDPRLFELQSTDQTILPNVSQLNDLTGRSLRSDSIDAGKRTVLWDVAGNPVLQFLDDDPTRQSRFEYDTLARPTAAYQNDSGGIERVRERWCYGEGETDQAAAKTGNLLGRCVRHYDTAGRRSVSGYSLGGKPLAETRQLVKDRSKGTDWQGADDAAWAALLETNAYTSTYTYDALDDPLSLVDAVGNRHDRQYNVAGQLTSIAMTQKGKDAVTVISDIRYDANGLRLFDQLGNGVTNEHSYDPSTLRLIASQTLRPPKEGRDPMLQDLYYDYDPVGNVIATYNYALNDSDNDNAGMLGESTFTYDACYQLCATSARENASARQGPTPPDPITPIVIDPTQMSPYGRTYSYDRAGNLQQIKHKGAVSFTQDFVVSSRSNRSVLQTTTGIDPSAVDALFDAQGNPATLSTGATLAWNRYNQLAQVTTVTRSDGNPNDTESYFYDGQGQRVYKESKTLQSTDSGSVNTIQTLYLPGLTLRRTYYGSTLNEELHTLSIHGSSDQDIRILHWETGAPTDIANDQYRYSVNNQTRSNLIELDANADILTLEEYYPFGGTAVWSTKNTTEAKYKFQRYAGKERDITGLYYYGFRYYIPWMARWVNPDPAGYSDGLNVYEMTRNNPATYFDPDGHHSVSNSVPGSGFLWALVLQPAFFVLLPQEPGWLDEPIPDHPGIFELSHFDRAPASGTETGSEEYINGYLLEDVPLDSPSPEASDAFVASGMSGEAAPMLPERRPASPTPASDAISKAQVLTDNLQALRASTETHTGTVRYTAEIAYAQTMVNTLTAFEKLIIDDPGNVSGIMAELGFHGTETIAEAFDILHTQKGRSSEIALSIATDLGTQMKRLHANKPVEAFNVPEYYRHMNGATTMSSHA